MGVLIWIIVFVIIISSVVRNSAAGKSRGKPGGADAQKAKTSKEQPYVKQAEPNKPQTGMKTAKPNKPKPGAKTAKPNKTESVKPTQPQAERAKVMRQTSAGGADKTRYGAYKQARQQGQSPSTALHQTNVDDILESARENTQAVQLDNDMDTIEIGDLMAKVQDNIVMGPADTLTFQRDFVAEGMDMLNRYTMIPGTEV